MIDPARAQIAEDFLRRIFGKVQGNHYVSLWHLPKKYTQWAPVQNLAHAAQIVASLDAQGADVYYGVCPHATRPPSGRGTKQTVAEVPALWVDMDIEPPAGAEAAHNAHRRTDLVLPPSIEAVAAMLDEIPDLPPPSIVVSSGYGLHLYWTLAQPLDKEAGAFLVDELQDTVIAHAAQRGWYVDKLADTARVLRVPGTHNHKIAGMSAPEVLILDDSKQDYNADDFDAVAASSAELRKKLAAGAATLAPGGAPSAAGSDSPPDPAAAARDVPPDPSQAIDIAALRQKLGRIRNDDSAVLMRKVLKGESIAEPGARDRAMQSACSIVGFLAPHNDPKQLVDLFRPMLSEWAAESGAKLSVDDEIEKALDKIERAQGDKRRKEAEALAEAERFRSAAIAEARTPGAPPGSPVKGEAYTLAELEAFASEQGIGVEQLQRRWIIQKNDSFYILVEGEYKSPIVSRELLASLTRDLAPAPVRLTRMTKQGEVRKSVVELVSEYGQVARSIVATFGAQRSYYDAKTQAFHEAVAKLRPIEPVYNPHIDGWLRALGGPDADRLLDWLATVTDLSRPSSGLYLWGPKSAGKSMLAIGMARLWHDGGPSLLDNVLTRFNDTLERCPLLWADEMLPQDWGKKTASTKLREIISADTWTLNRKFLPGADLKGCVRVILTANNDRMLSIGDEDAGVHDVEAFGARFLIINVEQGGAAQYLESIGGRNGGNGLPGTEGWVDGDMIASHILWLRDNRVVTPGDRFIVEGSAAEMAARLVTGSNLGDAIIEWCARHLATPSSSAADVYVGDGDMLVNAKALVDAWNLHVQSLRVPATGRLQRALEGLSVGEKRINIGGQMKRFKRMNIDFIMRYAADTQIGDVSAMLARIAAPSSLNPQPQQPAAPAQGATNGA